MDNNYELEVWIKDDNLPSPRKLKMKTGRSLRMEVRTRKNGELFEEEYEVESQESTVVDFVELPRPPHSETHELLANGPGNTEIIIRGRTSGQTYKLVIKVTGAIKITMLSNHLSLFTDSTDSVSVEVNTWNRNPGVEFFSENGDIVQVDSSGSPDPDLKPTDYTRLDAQVSAGQKPGEATVIARLGKNQDSMSVTVKQGKLEIEGPSSVVAQKEIELTAESSHPDDTSFRWSFDSNRVEVLEEDGGKRAIVKGLQPGTAILTVVAFPSQLKAHHTLVVEESPEDGVHIISEDGVTKIGVGVSLGLEGETWVGGEPDPNDEYVWSFVSEPSGIISLEPSVGKSTTATANAEGVVTITAESRLYSGFSKTFTLTVGSIEIEGPGYLAPQDRVDYEATGTDDPGLTWEESSNGQVLFLRGSGKNASATAGVQGVSQITVSASSGSKGTKFVTVSQGPLLLLLHKPDSQNPAAPPTGLASTSMGANDQPKAYLFVSDKLPKGYYQLIVQIEGATSRNQFVVRSDSGSGVEFRPSRVTLPLFDRFKVNGPIEDGLELFQLPPIPSDWKRSFRVFVALVNDKEIYEFEFEVKVN